MISLRLHATRVRSLVRSLRCLFLFDSHACDEVTETGRETQQVGQETDETLEGVVAQHDPVRGSIQQDQ